MDSSTRRGVDACKNDCFRATVDVWRRMLHYEFNRLWQALCSNVSVHGEEGVIMMVARGVGGRDYVSGARALIRTRGLLSSRRRRGLAGSVALGQMMLATVKNCPSFVSGVCPDVVLGRLLDGIEYVVGVVYRSQSA